MPPIAEAAQTQATKNLNFEEKITNTTSTGKRAGRAECGQTRAAVSSVQTWYQGGRAVELAPM